MVSDFRELGSGGEEAENRVSVVEDARDGLCVIHQLALGQWYRGWEEDSRSDSVYEEKLRRYLAQILWLY